MRSVVFLGLFSISDAIGASTGFSHSDSFYKMLAVVLFISFVFDVIEFINGLIK